MEINELYFVILLEIENNTQALPVCLRHRIYHPENCLCKAVECSQVLTCLPNASRLRQRILSHSCAIYIIILSMKSIDPGQFVGKVENDDLWKAAVRAVCVA